MSKNNLNMEDLFRTQLDSYKVDPSPGLWQNVQRQILWKQFLSFSLQTFNVYYLAATISLAGMGGYLLFSPQGDEIHEETIQSPPEYTTANSSEFSTKNNGDTGNETIAGREESALRENTTPRKPSREKSKYDAKESPDSRNQEQRSAKRDSEQPLKQEGELKITDEDGKKSEMLPVSAGFNVNQPQGCSPLAINFENTSENALKYVWIFGDGGSSAERDPSYVFDEPGMYPVMLKITGTDGLDYTAQQTIQVFESPKALFEMDDAVDLSNSQPVYFYNYSLGADYFEWDFGDSQQSNLA
ncbi:MAG: PKD domain-containing protein, partial [Bacteroidales bacterium]|nr:PKD domain-containing protein [Bacteroidales bacterium]